MTFFSQARWTCGTTDFICPWTILHATGFGLPPNFEDCILRFLAKRGRQVWLKLTRTVFSLVAMLNFYFRFWLISHSNVCQNSFALENLNLAVNLRKKILQKYGTAAIFFLYGNKDVPSAELLRGRRCLRTRTFILFGLSFTCIKMWYYLSFVSCIVGPMLSWIIYTWYMAIKVS